jgi:predicted metal-dependent phosphoesterase TrpH
MHAPPLADLHLHSSHSDGMLEPAALVALCAARGVGMLALTDHDTVAGCAAARDACVEHGVAHVSGVEISCAWSGQTLHLIGLGFDAQDAPLAALLADIRARRAARIREMGERLERKARLPGREMAARVLATAAVPTRQHLARELVAAGQAAGIGEAFGRWLVRGRPGHAPAEWPALAAVIACLRAAGGRPVLAHPHRYKISAGAMRRLLGEFREAGGEAIEVAVGGMGAGELQRLGTLARNHGLAGSSGSDFHDPAVPWNPPGRFAKLPPGVEPLAKRLA